MTTEKVPETDESENMTVEEVEAGFEIEEPEDTEEAEDITQMMYRYSNRETDTKYDDIQ